MSEEKNTGQQVKAIPFSSLKPGMIVFGTVDCDDFTDEDIHEAVSSCALIVADDILSWVSTDASLVKKTADNNGPMVYAFPVREGDCYFATQLDAIQAGLADDTAYYEEKLSKLAAIREWITAQRNTGAK